MPASSEMDVLEADRQRRGLAACVMCGYSLRGLPAHHRCPECGLEFDELTEVLQPYSSHPVTKGFVIAISIVIAYYGVQVIVMMFVALGLSFGPLVGVLIVAAIAVTIFRYRKRRPFLMLARDGVFYRTRIHGPNLIPWNVIERVETPLPMTGTRNERYLYVFVSDRQEPLNLSAVVSGVGFADRAKNRILEMRDLRLSQAVNRPSVT